MGTDLQVTEKQVRIIIFFKNKFTQYKSPQNTDNNNTICNLRSNVYMKVTGIVRRIDDLGRVVIPKEIRRTMRIREGDPSADNIDTFRQVLYGDA